MSDGTMRDSIGRIQRLSLVAGVLLSAAGAGIGLGVPGLRDQFFNSYLVAFMLWIGLSVGSLALVALHNLTGGGWGRAIRPTLESAAMTLPLMLVLFGPILAGMHSLYDWTHYTGGAGKLVDAKMRWWLNTPMFVGRSAFYLVLWSALSWLLARRRGGRTGAGISGMTLLLYALSVNFAAIDWMMSMRSEWYSTIYGMLVMCGQGVSAVAFAIIVLALIRRAGGPGREAEDEPAARWSGDLGNLALTFVMLWAYMAFSQYLIIWSGDISHETTWYLDRLVGGWTVVGVMLLTLHFAAPFVLLLQRSIKRNPRRLAWVATLLIVMRLMDMIWLVQPNLHGAHAGSPAWGVMLSPVVWLGMGGFWVAAFLQGLKNRPMPNLADESPAHADPAPEALSGEVAHG